jgi:hypothetical protein
LESSLAKEEEEDSSTAEDNTADWTPEEIEEARQRIRERVRNLGNYITNSNDTMY